MDEDASGEKSQWPPKPELERWLMNTAQDGDESAGFLRKMLQMNPAYGTYLANDTDLLGLVQLFAKRFRSKIIGSERKLRDDPNGKLLYEPLCEIAWRVIGQLFHSMVDLEDTGESFPAPREALGQVKMLLDTNMALSKRLNDMRRAYLRELTGHRDRQRTLTERAQHAVQILEEQPVMFYEPLDFVLDDTTKQFVQEVVQERLKLDMEGVVIKRMPTPREQPPDEMDAESARLQSELAKLRAVLEREKAAAERATAECARMKAQEDKFKEDLERQAGELQQLRGDMGALTKQRNELHKQLQQVPEIVQSESGVQIQVVKEIVEKEVIVEIIVEKVGDTKIVKEDNSDEVKQLELKIKELEASLQEEKQKPPEVQVRVSTPVVVEKTIEVVKKTEAAPSKKTKVVKEAPQTQIKEVIVEKESPELKAQLEKSLLVEKELREANKALEKALEDSKTKAQYRGPQGEKRNVDEEIREAMGVVQEQHKKRVKEQADEIKRLQQLLAEAEEKASKKEKKPPKEEGVVEEVVKKEKKVKEVIVPDTSGMEKWKGKHKELEEQHEALQGEYEKLEAQIRSLLDKIKELGGKEAVAEAMEEMKLCPHSPKKKKKEKAYERLYRDAQRRIEDMQTRLETLHKSEVVSLFQAATNVTDRQSLGEVVNLTHLQKASQATQSRFHQALSNFHSKKVAKRGADGDSSASDGDDKQATSGQPRSPRSLAQDERRDLSTPDFVAAEIHRLRAKNGALQEEIERLRALFSDLPDCPSCGQSGVRMAAMDTLESTMGRASLGSRGGSPEYAKDKANRDSVGSVAFANAPECADDGAQLDKPGSLGFAEQSTGAKNGTHGYSPGSLAEDEAHRDRQSSSGFTKQSNSSEVDTHRDASGSVTFAKDENHRGTQGSLRSTKSPKGAKDGSHWGSPIASNAAEPPEFAEHGSHRETQGSRGVTKPPKSTKDGSHRGSPITSNTAEPPEFAEDGARRETQGSQGFTKPSKGAKDGSHRSPSSALGFAHSHQSSDGETRLHSHRLPDFAGIPGSAEEDGTYRDSTGSVVLPKSQAFAHDKICRDPNRSFGQAQDAGSGLQTISPHRERRRRTDDAAGVMGSTDQPDSGDQSFADARIWRDQGLASTADQPGGRHPVSAQSQTSDAGLFGMQQDGPVGMQSVPLQKEMLRRAENGLGFGADWPGKADRLDWRAQTPQPTFGALTQKPAGSPGARNPSRTPSPPTQGIIDRPTSSVPVLPPAWRQVSATPADASVGAVLQRPTDLVSPGSLSPPWTKGASSMTRSASSVLPVGARRPWRNEGGGGDDHVDAAGSFGSTTSSCGRTKIADMMSTGQPQPPPPVPASPALPTTQVSEKGPKRRPLMRSKEDTPLRYAPVNPKPTGFCVTALRSQESLLALST